VLDDEAAAQFIADEDILWYQRFNLSENVATPGSSASVIEWTFDRAGVPERLDGLSVLDVGTTNGGAAFIAEARGAKRIVAVDLCTPEWFGFDRIKDVLHSNVEFLQGSLYELPNLLKEKFDIVFFLGVLYHLRHPLLAMDCLRELTTGVLYIETAVGGEGDDPPRSDFYRFDSMAGDNTNWFVPTVACLVDWVASSGFILEKSDFWPEVHPTRALAVARPEEGPPEYVRVSYEAPLSVVINRQ